MRGPPAFFTTALLALLFSCGSGSKVPLTIEFVDAFADGSSQVRSLVVESEPASREAVELRVTSVGFTGDFTLQWYQSGGQDIVTPADENEFAGLYFHLSSPLALPPADPPAAPYVPPATAITAGASKDFYAIVDPADCSQAIEPVTLRVLVLPANSTTSDSVDLFVEAPLGGSCP